MLTESEIRQVESALPMADHGPSYSDAIDIHELPKGARLEVETGHTRYLLENLGDGKMLISGHPTYCPEPVVADFQGAVGGSSLLKIWQIEPGLKMAFQLPDFGVVRTSRVRSIRRA